MFEMCTNRYLNWVKIRQNTGIAPKRNGLGTGFKLIKMQLKSN